MASIVTKQLAPVQYHPKVERLVRIYRDSPIYPLVTMLVQSSPFLDPRLTVLAALYAGLEAHIDQILSRTAHFADSLYFDDIAAEDALRDPNFIHCGLLAFDEALRGPSTEKAEQFARLLSAGLESRLLNNLDMYFEYFDALRQLSMREMAVLNRLESYETNASSTDSKNRAQMMSSYWDQFIDGIVDDFGIPEGETGAFLYRLTRTGCFETFAGQFFDHKYGQGMLTPMYYRLKVLISSPTPSGLHEAVSLG